MKKSPLQMLLRSFRLLLGGFLVFQVVIRMVRRFYKFPIPQFMANLIDNPLRRRIQPPDEMPLRHRIQPGMQVLEVGPGNGTYSLAFARRLGSQGRLITVDIEPLMLERVTRRAQAEGVENIDARLANVHHLPFEDGSFDAVSMITVIGEIPEPRRALAEFLRVLKPGGLLAFSELFLDPDYPRAATLSALVVPAGFKLREKLGNWMAYTLVFEKVSGLG